MVRKEVREFPFKKFPDCPFFRKLSCCFFFVIKNSLGSISTSGGLKSQLKSQFCQLAEKL